LRWDSLESASKAPREEVEADIKNYTSVKPITLAGVTDRIVKL
jgi:hypothetical protein